MTVIVTVYAVVEVGGGGVGEGGRGGVGALAASLDLGSPQAMKSANNFQALKPLGSDLAVATALMEAS